MKNLLELIVSELIKFRGYKINIQNYLYFYVVATINWKLNKLYYIQCYEKYETWTNLTKDCKDLYTKDYKILLRNEDTYWDHGLEGSIF